MSVEKPCFILVDPELFEENEESEAKSVIDEEITNFINNQQSKATKYSTNFAVNVFTRFCREINEYQNIDSISKDRFNKLLCKFFMGVKKKDGKEYETDSLSAVQRGIHEVF